MFMAADRQPKMRAMIMARTEPERRAALAELLPLQQADFEGLFAAMPGKPITIRLLDPPLHEFLPDPVQLAQRVQKARDERAPELPALEQELELVERLGEVNPMLGTRGCRLGIVHPEIYEMQVEAIMLAARAADQPPRLEIMIPLVDFEAELAELHAMVRAIGERHGLCEGEHFIVGTMIELPRACFIADRLAADAEFFSFGTNDLTQTALGFSRDDVEAGFVPAYLERRILDRSPFESIDVDGVGALVEIAVDRGRSRRKDIELGVCGEHGGDPDSIAFFHRAGLDYVSCSPYRLPIARVAAAQAALA
jgi:pyruvate,orthophosphate dikinase